VVVFVGVVALDAGVGGGVCVGVAVAGAGADTVAVGVGCPTVFTFGVFGFAIGDSFAAEFECALTVAVAVFAGVVVVENDTTESAGAILSSLLLCCIQKPTPISPATKIAFMINK
jgi:hypothetical protein